MKVFRKIFKPYELLRNFNNYIVGAPNKCFYYTNAVYLNEKFNLKFPEEDVFEYIIITTYGTYGKKDNGEYIKSGIYSKLNQNYEISVNIDDIEDEYDKSIYLFFIKKYL